MSTQKKSQSPRPLPKAIRDAQSAVDSAVVRGLPHDDIEKLRIARDRAIKRDQLSREGKQDRGSFSMLADFIMTGAAPKTND